MQLDFLNHNAVLAGLAVTIIVQAFKLKAVPWTFVNKYPVPFMLLVSLIAAMSVVGFSNISWSSLPTVMGEVAIISAITYNQILARWPELKAMESDESPSV